MAAHFPARLRAAPVLLAFLLLAVVLGITAALVGVTAQLTPPVGELPLSPPPVQVNAVSQPAGCGVYCSPRSETSTSTTVAAPAAEQRQAALPARSVVPARPATVMMPDGRSIAPPDPPPNAFPA